MLNTELLNRVADAIEQTNRFDLSFHVARTRGAAEADASWKFDGDDCQTSMCVAGWVNWLTREDQSTPWMTRADFSNERNAANVLGLDWDQSRRLFYAESAESPWVKVAPEFGWPLTVDDEGKATDVDDWTNIEPKQAAAVLRRIAAGELDL